MAWFDNDKELNVPAVPVPLGKEEVMEALTLDPSQIVALGKKHGYKVVKNDDDYEVIINNSQLSSPDFHGQFLDFWMGNSPEKQSIEHKRKIKNNTYALMDEIFGIATLTLNAYADEALGIGFIEQPVDIEFSDKEVGRKVKEILKKNGIIKRSRSHIRSLCKWGDLGVQIICPEDSNNPEDIGLKVITPDEWECFFLEKGPIPLGYKLTPKFDTTKSTYSKKKEEEILQPWEFVQMSVPDDELAPYGRSLLEAMRTSFDQLSTIEALLALSRVSRVERLIIKVPTQASNPTQAMAKMNQIKSSWKNAIFSDKSSGPKSHARTPSLQDIMFFPSDEGFSVDRLPSGSGVEFSSTDDVEFFRDNVLMMTGLPKGYLLADDSTDRYHALAAQDLKFARQLIPYQDAYAAGLTKLCLVLAGYCGGDIANIGVSVKIKRPIQMSDQLLSNNEAISRTAIELIENYKRANSTIDDEGNEVPPKTPDDLYAKLLANLGMADDIIKLFTIDPTDDPMLPGNSPDNDNITTSGILTDYLKERSTSNAIISNSSDILYENHALFNYFKTRGTDGKNILREVLIEGKKDVINKKAKWTS